MNQELNIYSEENIPKNSYVENIYYASLDPVDNNQESVRGSYNFKKKNVSSMGNKRIDTGNSSTKQKGVSNVENTLAKRSSVASKVTQGPKIVSYNPSRQMSSVKV